MSIKKSTSPLEQKMSREENIAYHNGCINTLAGEHSELVRLVGITETLIKAHMKELEKLGVKLEKPKETK